MNTDRDLHTTFSTKSLEASSCVVLTGVFLWGTIDLVTGWQGLQAMPGGLRIVLAVVFGVLAYRTTRRALNIARGSGHDQLGPAIERIDS
ncbi:hypothetical protein [Mycobacterium intracellulare]|uniref:hypothetical protein n=1 Tax=Mycobacterium intracellulare TaxID=1767 RepID=UPI002EB8FFF6|nr:hypothetical protein [Mycobacterium intracellulare]